MSNQPKSTPFEAINLNDWKWLREISGLHTEALKLYQRLAQKNEVLIVKINGRDAYNIYEREKPMNQPSEVDKLFDKFKRDDNQILYIDTVGGEQTHRDDLWAVSTDEIKETKEKLEALIASKVLEAEERTVKQALQPYSYSMPMRSARSRNTAFKPYAVKFFNGNVKKRRERMLAELKALREEKK
jgi:hypothetical protein